MTTRFCKGIRAGDEWVYQTNSGGISRIIVGFDDDTVFYRSYGDIYEKRCKAATFNRWLRGARLEFRRPSGVKECWACNGTRVVTTSSNGSGLIEAPCANCTDGVSNEALEQHATAPSDETPQLLDKLSDDLWSALSFIDSTVCREEVEKIAMRLDEDRRRIAGVAIPLEGRDG